MLARRILRRAGCRCPLCRRGHRDADGAERASGPGHRSRRLWHGHHLHACADAWRRAAAASLGRAAAAAGDGHAGGARDDVPLRRRDGRRRDPAIEWRGCAVRAAPDLARQHAGGCRAGGRCSGAAWPHPCRPDPPSRRTRLWRDGAGCRGQRHGDQGRPCRRRGWHRLQRRAPCRCGNRAGGAQRHRGDLRLFPGHRPDRLPLVVSAGVGAGAIPTNGGRHCIFAAMPPGRLRHGPWRDDRQAAFGRDAARGGPDIGGAGCRRRAG